MSNNIPKELVNSTMTEVDIEVIKAKAEYNLTEDQALIFKNGLMIGINIGISKTEEIVKAAIANI